MNLTIQTSNLFAVNGAVHYANALLHHTSYTDIIAIGMTGYKDELGKLKHSIAVYYVSKNNLGVGQKSRGIHRFIILTPDLTSLLRKLKP